MKFKLVEEFDILENVRQNIKNHICSSLGKNASEGYVLHHIHNEKYVKDDEKLCNDYKNVENCVIIPRTTKSGNDVHHLIHFLAEHEDELDTIKGYGIKDGKPVEYTLNELVQILKGTY